MEMQERAGGGRRVRSRSVWDDRKNCPGYDREPAVSAPIAASASTAPSHLGPPFPSRPDFFRCAELLKRQVPELVDDQQPWLREEVDLAGKLPFAFGPGESGEQCGRAGEKHAVACLDRCSAWSDRQVSLAHPGEARRPARSQPPRRSGRSPARGRASGRLTAGTENRTARASSPPLGRGRSRSSCTSHDRGVVLERAAEGRQITRRRRLRCGRGGAAPQAIETTGWKTGARVLPEDTLRSHNRKVEGRPFLDR